VCPFDNPALNSALQDIRTIEQKESGHASDVLQQLRQLRDIYSNPPRLLFVVRLFEFGRTLSRTLRIPQKAKLRAVMTDIESVINNDELS
jgi:hypothetical protein